MFNVSAMRPLANWKPVAQPRAGRWSGRSLPSSSTSPPFSRTRPWWLPVRRSPSQGKCRFAASQGNPTLVLRPHRPGDDEKTLILISSSSPPAVTSSTVRQPPAVRQLRAVHYDVEGEESRPDCSSRMAPPLPRPQRSDYDRRQCGQPSTACQANRIAGRLAPGPGLFEQPRSASRCSRQGRANRVPGATSLGSPLSDASQSALSHQGTDGSRGSDFAGSALNADLRRRRGSANCALNASKSGRRALNGTRGIGAGPCR